MRRRSEKLYNGRPCASCRSRAPSSQAALLLHRTRDLLIRQRSSLISSIRAYFAEFGIVASRGVRDVDRLLQNLTESHTHLPKMAREMLGVLADQLREVAASLEQGEGVSGHGQPIAGSADFSAVGQ
jgi:transposase